MTKKEVEEAGIKQLFSKALVKNADWQDKDDLLDVLYWGRQGLSLILGIIWGILPITGIIGIGLYLAISTFAGHYYITNYQSQDEETFGGFWELSKEGFASAIATFLVSWITVYSAIHFAG